MKIETKYNIGDKVWVVFFGEPIEIEITNIRIDSDKKGVVVYYSNKWLCEPVLFPENEVYATKEELIEKLTAM